MGLFEYFLHCTPVLEAVQALTLNFNGSAALLARLAERITWQSCPRKLLHKAAVADPYGMTFHLEIGWNNSTLLTAKMFRCSVLNEVGTRLQLCSNFTVAALRHCHQERLFFDRNSCNRPLSYHCLSQNSWAIQLPSGPYSRPSHGTHALKLRCDNPSITQLWQRKDRSRRSLLSERVLGVNKPFSLFVCGTSVDFYMIFLTIYLLYSVCCSKGVEKGVAELPSLKCC